MVVDARLPLEAASPAEDESDRLRDENAQLRRQLALLEARVRQGDERRRAMVHIMDDLNSLNKKLADQRKAMIHILRDYESDRRRLVQQTERLDNTRRALLHILQDSHQSNIRLEKSRKAMIHMMSDLSETTTAIQQREQELRDKQEQLVQAGKLATLGELTTGVAHELNNPLNNIGLFIGNAVDLIELGMAESDQARVLRDLHTAMQQVHKASEIISHSVSPAQLPPIQGDTGMIEQILMNLAVNARDAMPKGGELTISTEPAKITEDYVKLHAYARSGSFVCMQVKDTGTGMDTATMKRIFEPFFTTKEVGKGTGLGLSITYGIIKEHRGTISVRNLPGAGAEFVLQLPLAKPEDLVGSVIQ